MTAARALEFVANLARDARGSEVDIVGVLAATVLVEHDVRGSEGIGFDDVGSRLKKARVDLLDDIGPRDAEELVQALKPVKIVQSG